MNEKKNNGNNDDDNNNPKFQRMPIKSPVLRQREVEWNETVKGSGKHYF